MRAIVVRQPYANQIAHGHKTIEYRRFRPLVDLPCSILIVAGKSMAEPGTEPPYGVALCTVEIVRVEREPQGGYAWHLSDPRWTVRVPIRGRQGIWWVGGSQSFRNPII